MRTPAPRLPEDRRTKIRHAFWALPNVLAGSVFRNMGIGGKLTIGFGILGALTLVVIALSYLGSYQATININRTSDVRAPTALASSRAQANLLRMLADVRGYLALGDQEYRTGYSQAKQAFEADLAELEQLAGRNEAAGSSATDVEYDLRLEELESSFAEWSELPERLFDLRDDQLQREPGLRILIEEGNPLITSILVDVSSMIETQGKREPTAENMALLGDMSTFQASFFAMIAGLRGYVTTGRDSFKFEYLSNLTINDTTWGKLVERQTLLTETQRAELLEITQDLEAFLPLPQQMFEAVEGEHAREDLFLFRTEAVPLTETMLQLLDEVTAEEQKMLQTDLGEGRQQLASTQRRILVGGVVAFFLGLVLALTFRENIAGPVRRLTAVAEQIRTGDLEAQASVESGDEIGTLAETFNRMTGQLRQTLEDLDQRRRELQAATVILRRQNGYLAGLHDTSLGLISRLDLTDLLQALIVRAGQLLGTPHGFIYLAQADAVSPLEEGGVIQLKVAAGAFGPMIGEQVKPGEGLAGKVWHDGQPIVVDDYDAWPDRLSSLDHNVIRAAVGVPLTRTEAPGASAPRTVGVIGLAYDAESDQAFDQDEVELLGRFAQLASIALDNARLHTAAQDYLREVARVTDAAAAVEDETFDAESLEEVAARKDALGQLARVFQSMAREVYARAQRLKQQVQELRIELDQTRQAKKVAEITETGYFQSLRQQADSLRDILNGS